jgi:hypothetical protein
MTHEPETRQQTRYEKWKRPLFGAAASLVLFIIARLFADRLYPMGSYPLANQVLFMGTPFLALSFFVHGISALGLPAANVINAICWALLGATVGRLVRKPLIAVVVWLLVAGAGSALVFAGIIFGMMSGSP